MGVVQSGTSQRKLQNEKIQSRTSLENLLRKTPLKDEIFSNTRDNPVGNI